MLKKTGIAAAVVVAGLLAASPLAFAHTVNQDKHQVSEEGNGILHGDNVKKGNGHDLCEVSVPGLNKPGNSGKACSTKGKAYGQKVDQYHENDN